MKILIIGSGGREHCLAWKIAQSPRVEKLFSAPGNAGLKHLSECVSIKPEETEKLADFAEKNAVDLTVVGPEAPLALGIVDIFSDRGLKVFGPSMNAAKLESSKVFCKEFLKSNNIPAAESESFSDIKPALNYLETARYPLVVKADGLCAGKGVAVCDSAKEAKKAVSGMMEKRIFREAGKNVLIEEYLQGEEVSFMVLSDGKNVLPLLPSQDHKAACEGDRGPNTGGMGAYAPTRVLNSHPKQIVLDRIIEPVIKRLREDGSPYRGVLYAGLMMTSEGPKVLEFNARFGDPETQAILPLLKTDILGLLESCADGTLDSRSAEWNPGSAVCVIMASAGYPGKYAAGKIITGTEKAREQGAVIFHSGTVEEEGRLLTAGGRVLGVTATGEGLKDAIDKAYRAAREIRFEGYFYREDIGWKGLKHSA